jgi:hypothetical protein
MRKYHTERQILLDASKEITLEVKAEKAKYALSRHQNTGQNNNNKDSYRKCDNF